MIIYIITQFINLMLNLLELAILVECISSFFAQAKYNKYINMISTFTYPILEPFRQLQNRFMPGMMIDFSPIFALVFINIIRKIIFGILF